MTDMRENRHYDPVHSWTTIATSWPRRTRIAAGWLGGETSVADIGCGTMALSHLLPVNVRYVGVDIAARDERTIVVDLNEGLLPPIDVEAVAALGVVEYIHDVDRFLRSLSTFKIVVISYNHKSVKDLLLRFKRSKEPINWQHHLSKREFENRLCLFGLLKVKQKEVRMGETIYLLVGNNI